ncbi:MAG: type 3 dihydrofolate reductase [Pseudomonadota bacterium]
MKISIIAAMDQGRVIGVNNQLPWKLPADMQWFRRHTLGKPVLMGRNTYESIGKPLPGRLNIILTREKDYAVEGAVVVHHLDEAMAAAGAVEEVMVIGGAALYEQMLGLADRLYITQIHQHFAGDAWFPKIDPQLWVEIERSDHQPDERNPYSYSFMILERRR